MIAPLCLSSRTACIQCLLVPSQEPCTQSGAIQEKCGNPVCCPDCGNLSGIILQQQLQLIPPLHEMYIAC